jgi:hypothetical protein
MKAITVFAAVLAAASTCAAAGDSNWSIRFGPFFPNTDTAGVSTDPGFGLGVAYRAINTSTYSLEIESMGSAYNAEDALSSATIDVSTVSVQFLGKAPNGRLYGGILLGYTEAGAEFGNVRFESDTDLIYGLVVGTKISNQWFGEARYVTSDVRATRGLQLLGGYRF